MRILLLILVIGSLLVSGKGMAQNPLWYQDSLLLIQKGTASYYGKDFQGKKTASGEVFDMNAYTAAHKNLPFGVMIRVSNTDNGFQVIVRINDRLPQNSKRILDLSRIAAEQLDMIQEGLTTVELFALSTTAIEKLRVYYEEVPPGMRLRLYHRPVAWTAVTPDISFVLNQLKGYLNLVDIHFP